MVVYCSSTRNHFKAFVQANYELIVNSLTINNKIELPVEFFGPLFFSFHYGVVFSILKVFGTKKALWLLPVFSKEDLDKIPALQGLEFPTRSGVEA